MTDVSGIRAGPATAPRNYGDPAGEYEAARQGAAVVLRPDRVFLRVHGRDPVRMVQGLVSNDVAAAVEPGGAEGAGGSPGRGAAAPGRAVYATVLTPKGRMIADVRVLRRGEELLLETDAGAVEPLTAHLRKFVPPLFARFEDAGGTWTALTLFGPRAGGLLADVLDADIPADATPDTVLAGAAGEHDVVIVTTSYGDVPGFDILCHPERATPLRQALLDAGARPAGSATLEVLRIEAGLPRWGAELDEGTIPLEAGLRQRAISETKGCYTGQEVIIRILHRGHVNWLLRGMLLGDMPTPPAGTELHNADGKRVGRVTSAAWSPRHGQAVALGYVRREVAPGSTLRLATPVSGDATVVELPFPSPDT